MLNTKMTAKLACCVVITLSSVANAAQQNKTSTAGERRVVDEIRSVSNLIGSHVMNRSNTKVADIRDLVLTPEGEVRYAVLGYAGIAGVGQTYTAIPFDMMAIHHADGKWTANLNISDEEIKKSPTIRSENYREFTDPQWVESVHQFFVKKDESKARREGDANLTQRPRALEWVILAGKVRSAKLNNKGDEELGKVEDLLLDRSHRINFAIVGRGGVLGVGEEFIPVPWSKLRLTVNKETKAITALLDASKAQFDKAPLVKGKDYATLLGPGFADEVRRYFESISQSKAGG